MKERPSTVGIHYGKCGVLQFVYIRCDTREFRRCSKHHAHIPTADAAVVCLRSPPCNKAFNPRSSQIFALPFGLPLSCRQRPQYHDWYSDILPAAPMQPNAIHSDGRSAKHDTIIGSHVLMVALSRSVYTGVAINQI